MVAESKPGTGVPVPGGGDFDEGGEVAVRSVEGVIQVQNHRAGSGTSQNLFDR